MDTWIFLRGLTRECRHWGAFPETFLREVSDVLVCTPDLPGNGSLNAETSPRRVGEMAEHLRDDLYRQGVHPPYRLLAMSLGAMVAVAWAADHPEELRGCVLINTSLRPFSPFYRRLKPGSYSSLLRLALLRGEAREQEATILKLTSSVRASDDALLKDWTALRLLRPVSRANTCRQLLAAACYRAPNDKPRPPILILGSERDALVDVSCSRELARRWDCRLSIHPTAGHDLPLDDGLWVAREVRHWLSTSEAQVSTE